MLVTSFAEAYKIAERNYWRNYYHNKHIIVEGIFDAFILNDVGIPVVGIL